MKKLRLLVTKDCPRNCESCCNNNFDLDSLPIFDNLEDGFNYDEIMLTGGEPLDSKHAYITFGILQYYNSAKIKPKLYVYTANPTVSLYAGIVDICDGITITMHTQENMNEFLLGGIYAIHSSKLKGKSLRLKLMEGVVIPTWDSLSQYYKDYDLDIEHNFNLKLTKLFNYWTIIENVRWIENCPLPKDEEFKRLKYNS